MGMRKIILFTLGYSDNTSTNYLLNCFLNNGFDIDGIILCKSHLKQSWRRLRKKIEMRGIIPALRRVFENLFVRKRQISQLYQQYKDKVYYVDKINSENVRDILVSNKVELLILTSTPIIKSIILDIDGLTILNSHTGYLPKYRGLDANYKALRDGHPLAVSIHKVTKKLDAGDVYLREIFNIDVSGDIIEQIDKKELHLAGKLLVKAVNLISKNKLTPIAQDEPLGKYEPPFNRKERNKIIKNFKTEL
jgi:methionyl-tRNA formyltransferase